MSGAADTRDLTVHRLGQVVVLLEEIAVNGFGRVLLDLGIIGDAATPKIAAYRKFLKVRIADPIHTLPPFPRPEEENPE
jgi:hypothetical protein